MAQINYAVYFYATVFCVHNVYALNAQKNVEIKLHIYLFSNRRISRSNRMEQLDRKGKVIVRGRKNTQRILGADEITNLLLLFVCMVHSSDKSFA